MDRLQQSLFFLRIASMKRLASKFFCQVFVGVFRMGNFMESSHGQVNPMNLKIMVSCCANAAVKICWKTPFFWLSWCIHLSNEKRAPGCLGDIGEIFTSQLCGDYNETIVRIPTQQPVWFMESTRFFSWLIWSSPIKLKVYTSCMLSVTCLF